MSEDEVFGKDGFVCHTCEKPIGIDVVIIQSKEEGTIITRLYDKACYIELEKGKDASQDN